MVFIFGGAYQGKLGYACERFGPSENDIYHCSEDCTGRPETRRVVYGLEKWLFALIKAGIDTDSAVQGFIDSFSGEAVICRDISCGIVPVDPDIRAWREACGRASAKLAEKSDEVVRLFCSIPTRIK